MVDEGCDPASNVAINSGFEREITTGLGCVGACCTATHANRRDYRFAGRFRAFAKTFERSILHFPFLPPPTENTE